MNEDEPRPATPTNTALSEKVDALNRGETVLCSKADLHALSVETLTVTSGDTFRGDFEGLPDSTPISLRLGDFSIIVKVAAPPPPETAPRPSWGTHPAISKGP